MDLSSSANHVVGNLLLEGLDCYKDTQMTAYTTLHKGYRLFWKQEVKVIWQKAPHGGPIPRLGVAPGGRKLYHWIPGVGFPISVP